MSNYVLVNSYRQRHPSARPETIAARLGLTIATVRRQISAWRRFHDPEYKKPSKPCEHAWQVTRKPWGEVLECELDGCHEVRAHEDRWALYEQEKRRLRGLAPAEYERRCADIAERLGL